MANLTETPAWVSGIYQLETSDPVLGGPDGIDNLQAKQLANRTGFLKKQIDDTVSGALTVMYANKLKTPRSISMTGDGTWTTSFDGSGNVTAAMALSNSGITPSTYKSVTVDAKGRITAGSNPTTLAGYGITDGLSTSNYTAADVLAKIKTVDGTGSGLDADLLDGKDSPYFLDLANSTGTLPSARLTGTYTDITLKNGPGNTIINDGGAGARTVSDLVQYRGPASVTGAIVFLAPPGLNSVMHMLHILGFDYNNPPKNVDCIVQGYRNATVWSRQHLTHSSVHKPTIRLARKISTNQSAFIIGDVDNVWAYPHFSISQALFSHSGATDAYCVGWNSEVISELTDYDNLIVVSDTPSLTSMPWSQITGVPSTLPNQNISGNAGTATKLATARTISLTGDATGSATFDGSANASMAVTVNGTKINQNNTWTRAQRGAIVALTYGTTITPDFALSNNFKTTLTGNATLATPTNLVEGQSGIITITQDVTGNRTLGYSAIWKFIGGIVPSLSTSANAVDELVYYVNPDAKTVFAILNKDIK